MTLRNQSRLILFVLLNAHCGAPDKGDSSPPPAPHHQNQCLACTTPVPASLPSRVARPSLRLTPQELTFFSDYEGTRLDTRALTVSNATEEQVVLYNARIKNFPGLHSGKEGAAFFKVDWPSNFFITLYPEDETEVLVTFTSSRRQKSASLWISTSHPDFPQLEVLLTGKHFSGFGQF